MSSAHHKSRNATTKQGGRFAERTNSSGKFVSAKTSKSPSGHNVIRDNASVGITEIRPATSTSKKVIRDSAERQSAALVRLANR